MARRCTAAVGLLALALVTAGGAWAQPVQAPSGPKARGVFAAYAAGDAAISVKERGRERWYALLGGGDAGETEVIVEARAAGVSDLVVGAPVIVTWRPDPLDPTRRVALRIEVPAIPRSFREDLR